MGAPPTTHLNFRATHGGSSPALQRLPGAAPGVMLPPSLNTWWGAPVIPPARRVARRSPPSAPLRRRSSPILHTTTPRVAEVRATRSAMPLLIVVAAARGCLRRTMPPPALSPEEEPWRTGGGATHAPRTTDRADRRQAHIPPGASVGSALGCAALDTSGSGPPGGSADGLAVLAGAAVPSPAPSHRLRSPAA